MRLICNNCAHVYDIDRYQAGDEDGACSATPRGTLRPPTQAEEILLERYADLHEQFQLQATELREALYPQGTLL